MRPLPLLALAALSACGCGGSDGPAAPSGAGDAGLQSDAVSEAALESGVEGSSEAGQDSAPCEPGLTDGLYEVTGSDSLGAYAGTVEWSAGHFVRAITYASHTAGDGAGVAQVAEGTATEQDDAVSVSLVLQRVGFITAVGTTTREGMSKAPALTLSGSLGRVGCQRYEGVIEGTDSFGTVAYSETWQRTGPVGPAAMWQNQRQEILTADSADSSWLLQYFVPQEYADSARIAPYKDYPEFVTGIALAVFDPTDYDFYREAGHENVYRVIQQVVDPISETEASLRATAYRYSLADKEKFFGGNAPETGDVQVKSINPYGMMSHWNEADQDYHHDGDALLWTGVYTAAMAMKFLETGDDAAREQMLKSLDGTIKCLEITGSSTEFARTIRTYIDGRTYDVGDPSEWVRGTGAFSQLEWKVNGNNDMSKGFLTAFLWSSLALHAMSAAQAADATATYGDLYQRMFDRLRALRDGHALYQWSSGDVTNLPAWYAANITLKVLAVQAPTIADDAVTVNPLHWPLLKQVYEQEIGYINEGGVSDWSGNHLGILGDMNLYTAFVTLGRTADASDLAGFIRDGGNKLKRHRLGFFQIVAGTLGSPSDPDNVADGVWVLREMSIPKTAWPINWEQNPGYCMSPTPELVWKMDWKTNDRTQSIRAYPLFERPPSSYAWKDNPYRQYFGQGDAAWTGIDFLIAYWFGRHHGALSADD